MLKVRLLVPALVLISVAFIGPSSAAENVAKKQPALSSPELTIPGGGGSSPHVALTLDACSGKVDTRILDALVNNRIPATIFVTGRWLRNNSAAVETLKAHPELFEMENHGAQHLAAVFDRADVEGVRTAGSPQALETEIADGAAALVAIGISPHWYRGATALYSPSALPIIAATGYQVAGFSLNADQGASLAAQTVARRIAAARDGDVIIAHINQPARSSGAGVAAGILALKEKGFRFVRLSEATGTAELRPGHELPAR